MQKLNKEATAIFCQLLMHMKPNDVYSLTRKHFHRIDLTRLQGIIKMDMGIGQYYRLVAYFNLGHKIYRDPELQFVVVDNRQQLDDLENLSIYPLCYRQDFAKARIDAMLIKDKEVVETNSRYFPELCQFSEYFLQIIKCHYLRPSFWRRLFAVKHW